MHLQCTIGLAIVGVLAAAAIPVFVYRKVVFKPAFTPAEQAVAAFTPGTLSVASKTWQESRLNTPVAAPLALPKSAPASASGTVPTAAAPPPPAPPPTVSFIIQDGGKGMAIIGGAILKEGDRYHEWQVERIERNRVLLRGRKGTTWVTMQ